MKPLFSIVLLLMILGGIAWWLLQSFSAEYGIGDEPDMITPMEAAEEAKSFMERGLGGNQGE